MTHTAHEILVRLPLRDESDVAAARGEIRAICKETSLGLSASEAMATALSEIAHNAILHAGGGEVLLGIARAPDRVGVVAIIRDLGPGIPDIEEALKDGYSTGNGLGLGLPSARRLVDEFDLRSSPEGTNITLRQWSRRGA